MKIDINKTYHTKSGMPVVIYAIYEERLVVHGAYQLSDGSWFMTQWTLDGVSTLSSSLDLVGVRPERVVWINEYEYGVGAVYLTKADANNFCKFNRIALHRVVLNEDTVWQADADQADAEKEQDDE